MKTRKIRNLVYTTCLILLLLLSLGITFAFVNDTQKAKIEGEKLMVSETDDLTLSLNGGVSYAGSVSANDRNYSSYADYFNVVSLKDYSGDGIELFVPVVDSYTKQAQSSDWQAVRLDTIRNDSSESQVRELSLRNENKYYFSFDVWFKSNVELNVYLSRTSTLTPYVAPGNYCLLLKRIATLTAGGIEYSYEIDGEASEITDPDELPTVYNRSIYSYDFDDELDENALEGQEVGSAYTQTQFSANYIAGAMRVAFLDESKDVDYLDLVEDNGATSIADFDTSKLRMIWAPNRQYQSSSYYDPQGDSYSYDFTILSESDAAARTKQNQCYLCNTSMVAQNTSLIPEALFVDELYEGLDTPDSSKHRLVTLVKNNESGFYEAKLRVLMWVEGSDSEANVSLSAGSFGGDGAAKVAFELSFFGAK